MLEYPELLKVCIHLPKVRGREGRPRSPHHRRLLDVVSSACVVAHRDNERPPARQELHREVPDPDNRSTAPDMEAINRYVARGPGRPALSRIP